jgi:MFS family permease
MQSSESPSTLPAPPTVAEPGQETADRARRSALLIVFLVVFIDLLGFGIVLPLLPRFGDVYVAALITGGKTAPLGGLILGLLMASFSAMQFIFAPIWGRISDRIGRRPILLLGLTGSVLFYSLFGYASSLPTAEAGLALTLLFVARIGAGVAGATISTAQAVIADNTPPERRKHGMALIGAAFGIGFTFGPLFGYGSLIWFKDQHGAIGYTAAALSLIALVLGWSLLPETRRFDTAAPLTRKWLDRRALWTALHTPAVGPVILVFFLTTLGFGAFESTLALLLQDVIRLAEDDSFLVFAYVGLILLLTQGLLYRKLANRLSETTFMALGILFMGCGLLSLAAVNLLAAEGLSWEALLTLLLVSLAVAVVGFAFLTPSAQALISRRTSADKQGEILGVNQSASAMARILGPICGLSLYKLSETHLLPYLFGAGLLLLMLPLLPRIRKG